jgi:hypothetical protein
MARECDVCHIEVPAEVRFCPHCGLEITERRATYEPKKSALPDDAYDWSDQAELGPKEYVVSREQLRAMPDSELAERLDTAETRLQDGYTLDVAGTLKQLRPHVANRPAQRERWQRLRRVVVARKQVAKKRIAELTAEGDGDRLVALLNGPAANELEPEEICQAALDAARTLYDAQLADEAADVLRILAFKTLRDERLVPAHRELESLVQRRRMWQYWRRNVSVMGAACLAAAIGLTLWAWFLWNANIRGLRRLAIPLLLAVSALLVYLPQMQERLERKLRRFFEEKAPRDRLAEWWQRIRGR